jgi:hypothetical protein
VKVIVLTIGLILAFASASHAQGTRKHAPANEECPEGRQLRSQKAYPSSMTDCEILDADIAATNQRIRRSGAPGTPGLPPPQAKQEDPNQRQIDEDSKIGYSAISFDDFELDEKQLVAGGKKIAIVGYVRRIGSVDTLFPTEMKAFYVGQAPTAQIPLLTEDSPRDIRAYFLKCNNSGSKFGCWARVRGYASTCGLTTFGLTVPKSCLVVDGGWIRSPNQQ